MVLPVISQPPVRPGTREGQNRNSIATPQHLFGRKLLTVWRVAPASYTYIGILAGQRLALGHSGIIHARLPLQCNHYRVAFAVFRITRLHVLRPDLDRELLGFVGQSDDLNLRKIAVRKTTRMSG